MSAIRITITLFLLAAVFLVIGLLVYAFFRNESKKVTCFYLLGSAILFYTLGFLFEVNTSTAGEAMVALRIENLGIPFIAPFFLLMTISFFKPKLLRMWMVVASTIYGLIMFIIVFFNDYHLLYYTSIRMEDVGGLNIAFLGHGPLYIFQQLVSIALLLIAYFILGNRYLRGNKRVRNQMNYFIFGSLFGFVVNILNIFGASPKGIDLMPFALAIGMVFFAINLRRYRILDVLTIAFDMSIEKEGKALIVLDEDWGFVYCNQRAKMLFPGMGNFAGTEALSQAEGWPKDIDPKYDDKTTFVMKDPQSEEDVVQSMSVVDVLDKKGRKIGVMLTITDITEFTNAINEMQELATTDHLTGIYNRRHFKTLVEKQIKLAREANFSIGLMMFDLDHFKKINDNYGHPAGDVVLLEVAKAVSGQLRSNDVLARYGGEEFVIFAPERSTEGVTRFADRLRKTIEDLEIVIDEEVINVTASFGAAIIMPGHEFDKSIEVVDSALYEAKRSGRNRVVVGEIPIIRPADVDFE